MFTKVAEKDNIFWIIGAVIAGIAAALGLGMMNKGGSGSSSNYSSGTGCNSCSV